MGALDGVNLDSSNYTVQKTSTAANNNKIDKDAFLKLLTTQLKYQDPLNPSNDQEFLAQMAQFTSLEQMQNLNKSASMSQAYSLIGKQVSGSFVNSNTSETETVSGVVTGVKNKSGNIYIVVGTKEISIDKIENISDDSSKVTDTQMYDQVKTISDSIKEIKTALQELKKTATQNTENTETTTDAGI